MVRKAPADDESTTGITFRDNGSVSLHINGSETRLRPALLEDYKDLVSLWRDATDELRVLSDEAMAWSNDLQAVLAKEERIPTPDERAEDVKRGREISDRTDELALLWWEQAITRMAPPETVPVLAPWMVDPTNITQVIEHWRTRPSRSGAR